MAEPASETTSKRGTKKTNGKPAEPEFIEVLNPISGLSVGKVPVHGDADIGQMADKARRAFEDWSQWPFSERAEAMLRFRELLLDRLDEGLDLLVAETGKTRPDAIADFIAALNTLTYYVKKGEKFLRDKRRTPFLAKNKSIYVSHKPMGVAGIISPWNFPFELSVSEAVPAMLAGCTVIIKPSEVTPLIVLWAAELFRDSGLPEGVLQVTTGDGRTGAALIKHVDRITFTGSTATGRKVAKACADKLIPFTLELGGKDPMIVCEDADLDRAANGAVFGAFFNAGQMCTSVERCYVMDAVHDEFVDRVVEVTRNLRMTEDEGGPQDIGSITFPPQIDIIQSHVADAKDKGAKVLTGGKLREDLGPLVWEPTVLVDVNHEMKIMRDETFGPVLPIMRVTSDEEAVRLANDSVYGLNSAVWSADPARARRIARRLQVGTTEINDAAGAHIAIESPFGGVKESGVGRRRGPEGLRKFCHPQTVTRDLLGMKKEIYWYPLPDNTMSLFKKALNLLYRRTWTGKLLGR